MGYIPLAIFALMDLQCARERLLRVLRARLSRLNHMISYTVFFNPTDYPGLYVVRPFVLKEGAVEPMGIAWTGQTIDEVRAKVPRDLGLVRFSRSPEDHPSILEVWL